MLSLKSSLSKLACVFFLSNMTASLEAQIATRGWSMQLQNPSVYLGVIPECSSLGDGTACYIAVHVAEGKPISKMVSGVGGIAYSDNNAASGFVSDTTPLVVTAVRSDFESAQNQIFLPWAQNGLASISFSEGTPDVYKTQFLSFAQEWGFSDAQNSSNDWQDSAAMRFGSTGIIIVLTFLPFL